MDGVGRGRAMDGHSRSDADSRGRSHGADSRGRSHGTDSRGRSHGADSRGRSHGADSRGRSHGADSRGRSRGADSRGRSRGADIRGRGRSTDGHGTEGTYSNGLPIRLPWETPFQYYLRCLGTRTPRNSFNYDTYVNDMRRSVDPDNAPLSDTSSSDSASPSSQQNPNRHPRSQNIDRLRQNENSFLYQQTQNPFRNQQSQGQNQQHQQSQNIDPFQQTENPFLYQRQDPIQYLQIQCNFQYQQNENALPSEQNQNPEHHQFQLNEDPLQNQPCQFFDALEQSDRRNIILQNGTIMQEIRNPGFQEQSPNSDESQIPINNQNSDQYDQCISSECATGGNASSLYKSIVSIVECNICLNTLIPPIFYCKNGHNICGNCRKQVRVCPTCRAEFTNARNFIVEEILMKILYPCKHKEQGCTAVMLEEKKAQHEATCMFGNCECCVYVEDSVRCSWQGFRSALVSHVRDVHGARVDDRDNVSFRVISARTEMKDDCSLKIALGEMFWCHSKLDANVGLLKTVQYIGPPENAKYFKYSFHYAHSTDCPSLSYSNFVCSLDENIDTLFNERNCFHITQETYTTMVRNGAIKFLLEVADTRR